MTEREKREVAQVVAIQQLYFLGQQEKGRFLNQEEMVACMRSARRFLADFFGDRIEDEPDIPLRATLSFVGPGKD